MKVGLHVNICGESKHRGYLHRAGGGGGGRVALRSWASGLGFMQGPEPQTRKALTPAINNGLHHGYADILSEGNRV